MGKVNVKVEGVEKTVQNLKEWQQKKRKAVSGALITVGYKVQATTQARVDRIPVLSNRLRSSITTNWSGSGQPRIGQDGVGQPDGEPGMVVVVGTNVLYSHMQEFGSWGDGPKPTGKMLPMPDRREYEQMTRPPGGFQFLTKAYFEHENEVPRRIEEALKKDEHL